MPDGGERGGFGRFWAVFGAFWVVFGGVSAGNSLQGKGVLGSFAYFLVGGGIWRGRSRLWRARWQREMAEFGWAARSPKAASMRARWRGGRFCMRFRAFRFRGPR